MSTLTAGAIASAHGALTVWLALRAAPQPFWGLLGALAGFLAVRRPDLAILLAVPVATVGIGWPLLRLVAMAMIAAVGYAVLIRPGRACLRVAHAGALALIAALTVSCVWPQVFAQPMRHFDLVTLGAGITVFMICAAVRVSVRLLCATVALSGALAATLVLMAGSYGLVVAQWDAGRLTALGQNPNGLGLLMTLPVVAAAGLAWHRRQPLWLAPAVPCAVVLALTESRGATIAVASGLAYVLVAGRRWWWQACGLVGSVIAALALIQSLYVAELAPEPPVAQGSSTAMVMAPVLAHAVKPSTPPPAPLVPPPPQRQAGFTGSRRTADLEYNNKVRLRVAALAVTVATENPLLGVGYGGFAGYAERTPGFGLRMGTHNEYLRFAAESGIPAVSALLFLLFLGLRRRDGASFAVPRAFVVAFAAVMLLTNPLSNVGMSIAFWAALGVLAGNRKGAVDDSLA